MGNYRSRQCGLETCTHEPRCARQCPSKFCLRVHFPYFGWVGTIGFLWEAFMVFYFSLMLFDVVRQDAIATVVLLLVTALVAVVLWIWNVFNCAPHYTLLNAVSNETLACPLLVKPSPCEYVSRLVWDARHKNDQAHMQTLLKGALFSLIMYSIFVGYAGPGLAVFNALSANATMAQVSYYVMAKVFAALVIAAIGINFALYLFETHTDFMLRHLSALSENHKEKGTEEPQPQRMTTGARRGGELPY